MLYRLRPSANAGEGRLHIGGAPTRAGRPMIIEDVLLLLHVMFFVYWLGTDLGVFYSSRLMRRTEISPETRRYCFQIFSFLDQAPRVSMAGIVTVGATLGILRGYITVDPIWIVPIWIVGIFWVSTVIYLYLNEHHPAKIATLRKVDFNFRLVMIAFLAGLAVLSLMGKGVIQGDWLAVKVLLFAVAMLCGVIIRVQMKDLPRYFVPMLKGTATPEDIATTQKMMASVRPAVLTIWAITVVAAALGLWKPF